ncbi:MAG: gluconate 2-dehydrogenase subunit 3 family protein [Acidobacteriaceae bacterium]|nr:gluconate 2-dehydrogenase subunit 3 family protein [Acidobacteriaceae bacterium]
MTRRGLFHLVLRAATLPTCAAFLSNWLNASHQHADGNARSAPSEPPFLRDYRPQFFGHDDFEALQAFTEILIPTDDTPGAREAHCAHFIDFVLSASTDYAPETQKRWRQAMTALRQAGFHAADLKQRVALVEVISRPERHPSAHHPAFAAYRLIKRESAFAFYTSRVGMIDCLDYRGNSYNLSFPPCTHPEHHVV